MLRLALLALSILAAAGCASSPPAFEEVPPAEDLYREGLEALEGRKLLWLIPRRSSDEAIEKFQTIVDNYPYSDYAVLAELKIADAYFEAGKYEEALSYYRDFGDLHPQHAEVPYTLYRSALCWQRQVRRPTRDQTPTRESLVYLDRLLSRFPHSSQAAEAEVLWRSLRTHLAEHVRGIGDFYRDRGEYESAAERYRMILNDYPGLGLDARALYELALCYTEMNRREEALRILQAIVQNYRESDVAGDAEGRIAALVK